MFNRIRLSMHLGKVQMLLPVTEQIYSSDQPPSHLTALLMPCTGLLSIVVKLLEEAAILATKNRTRLVQFPEGREISERTDVILEFVQRELATNRNIRPEGPDFNAVHQRWLALVRRYIELRQQVEFVD